MQERERVELEKYRDFQLEKFRNLKRFKLVPFPDDQHLLNAISDDSLEDLSIDGFKAIGERSLQAFVNRQKKNQDIYNRPLPHRY